jgi:hypothetical protein
MHTSRFPSSELLIEIPRTNGISMEESNSSFPSDLDFRKTIAVQLTEIDRQEVHRPFESCVKQVKPRRETIKQSLSFNTAVRYREIPHHRDLSEKRKSLIWETSATQKEIRKDARSVLLMMNCGLEVSEECGERGLFPMLHSQNWKRSERREEVYRDIARLQDLQSDFWCLFGDRGDISEMIARRYAYLSEHSKEEAWERALQDEAAVVPDPCTKSMRSAFN